MIFVREKSFYRTMMRLVIPITLQNVMGILLNMMDTVMLGRLGENSEEAITAAGLANQPFFVYTLFIFGIVSGASVLISQYWGKADTDTINSVSGIAFIAAMTIGTIFTSVCMIFTDQVMGLFTNSENVIRLGASYLRIVLISYIPAAITTLFCGIIKATEQVKIALFANSLAILMNIVLNYILIFGKLGFEPMGIVGAAIATLISRIIETSIVVFYIIFIEKRVKFSFKRMFRIKKELVFDFLHYCSPVIANETLWGIGITIHSAILGRLGEQSYAAYSIVNVIEKIVLLSTMGFANACAIIIGKEIGAGNKHKVYDYSKTLLATCVLACIVMEGFILLIREPIIGFFEVSDYTHNLAIKMMFIMAVVGIAKSFNAPNVVGVLRGGGDTLTAMLMDVLSMWIWAIPLGFLAAFVFKFPFEFVYLCLLSDELIKVGIGFIRFKSKKWIKNITR